MRSARALSIPLSSLSFGLLLAATAVVTAVTAACGDGGATKTGVVVVPSAHPDAGGAQTSAPPAGLPPMASMPAPGVIGSRKAKKKQDGALYACGGGGTATAKDPADKVKKTGEACAAASKMHAVGTVFRGSETDKDAHQEHKFKVEANKCYRVYFATDEAVKDAVVVLRDSNGDLVGESPGAALPEDGAFCFTAADDVTLMIAVGTGKGGYAAQVWSD